MNDIEEIIMTYGYKPIESNNDKMRSYVNEEGVRVNYYFTSGTVQIQTKVKTPTFPNGGYIIRNATTEQIEEIL